MARKRTLYLEMHTVWYINAGNELKIGNFDKSSRYKKKKNFFVCKMKKLDARKNASLHSILVTEAY